MRFLVSIYVITTVMIAGFMLFRDNLFWDATALLGGSVLGFAGGGGMRGAMYLGQRRSGMIIGLFLVFLGMGIVYYSDMTLAVFGLRVNGDIWPALGFVLAFLAARPSDVDLKTIQRD